MFTKSLVSNFKSAGFTTLASANTSSDNNKNNNSDDSVSKIVEKTFLLEYSNDPTQTFAFSHDTVNCKNTEHFLDFYNIIGLYGSDLIDTGETFGISVSPRTSENFSYGFENFSTNVLNLYVYQPYKYEVNSRASLTTIDEFILNIGLVIYDANSQVDVKNFSSNNAGVFKTKTGVYNTQKFLPPSLLRVPLQVTFKTKCLLKRIV